MYVNAEEGVHAYLHEQGQRRVKYQKKRSSHPERVVTIKMGALLSVKDDVLPGFLRFVSISAENAIFGAAITARHGIALIVANQSALNCHL